MYRVKKFRNCPNPDCSAHYPPVNYEQKVPDSVITLARGCPIMTCMHCGKVWYEDNVSANIKRYYIVREHDLGEWLEMPRIETYSKIVPKIRRKY